MARPERPPCRNRYTTTPIMRTTTPSKEAGDTRLRRPQSRRRLFRELRRLLFAVDVSARSSLSVSEALGGLVMRCLRVARAACVASASPIGTLVLSPTSQSGHAMQVEAPTAL